MSLACSLAPEAGSSDGVGATWAIALVDSSDVTKAAETAANFPFVTFSPPIFSSARTLCRTGPMSKLFYTIYDIRYILRPKRPMVLDRVSPEIRVMRSVIRSARRRPASVARRVHSGAATERAGCFDLPGQGAAAPCNIGLASSAAAHCKGGSGSTRLIRRWYTIWPRCFWADPAGERASLDLRHRFEGQLSAAKMFAPDDIHAAQDDDWCPDPGPFARQRAEQQPAIGCRP